MGPLKKGLIFNITTSLNIISIFLSKMVLLFVSSMELDGVGYHLTLQEACKSLCLLLTKNSAVISRGGFTSDASFQC